jgi:hypothetical protein
MFLKHVIVRAPQDALSETGASIAYRLGPCTLVWGCVYDEAATKNQFCVNRRFLVQRCHAVGVCLNVSEIAYMRENICGGNSMVILPGQRQ